MELTSPGTLLSVAGSTAAALVMAISLAPSEFFLIVPGRQVCWQTQSDLAGTGLP